MSNLFLAKDELIERFSRNKKLGAIPKSGEISQKDRAEQLKNDHTDLDLQLKKNIFQWVKFLVSFYLVGVATILVSTGLSSHFLTGDKVFLSDSVLITLLTTTTINVLGLPWLIIHSLFPKSKKQKSKKS
jgi:hypothetical protein